jgi:hypothetical protein
MLDKLVVAVTLFLSVWPVNYLNYQRSHAIRLTSGGCNLFFPTFPARQWSGRNGSGRRAGGDYSAVLPFRPVHGLEEVVLVGGLVVAAALFLPVRPVHGLEKVVLVGGLVVATALSYLSGQSMVWKKWFW